MRKCAKFFDQTKAPHKQYKYSYVPDPRKLSPMETVHDNELNPSTVRPPTKSIPNHVVFLEKCDVNNTFPTSDFKDTFKDWTDLMTMDKKTMVKNGIPANTAMVILKNVHRFKCGYMPELYDLKEEQQFWKQFKTIDNSQRRIPELPEKYRPHQHGVEQPPLPDYGQINVMPEWAQKEAERLEVSKE